MRDSLLTATQQKVAKSILDILGKASEERLAIVVLGLSGVGKDFVLSQIAVQAKRLRGKVYSLDDLRPYEGKVKPRAKHIITTATPIEYLWMQQWMKDDLPGFKLVPVVLDGMSQDEFGDFESIVGPANGLDLETLFKVSHGIPMLAQRMMLFRADLADATRMTLEHLAAALPRSEEDVVTFFVKYLGMPLTNEELLVIKQLRPTLHHERIYAPDLHFGGGLERVLAQLAVCSAESGVIEESPLFRTPESEGIYNRIMAERAERQPTMIRFFIPELLSEEVVRILEAFGIRGRGGWHCRLGAFGATLRKVVLATLYPGFVEVTDSEDDRRLIKEVAQGYNEQFLSGGFPLAPKSKEDKDERFGVFVQTREHLECWTNPANTGWALETLLQHQGIGYVADNFLCNQRYAYLADENRIEVLGVAVRI